MAVAATGFFDGVHIGHRKVIETLLEKARERGERSLVVTLWPHPRTLFDTVPDPSFFLLTDLDEKRSLIRSLGVDEVVTLDFTSEFAALTAAEYLEALRRDYGVTSIVLGYDNRLGSDRLTTAQIADLAASLGFGVTVCPPVSTAAGVVSSSAIRRLIAEGREAEASEMLGRWNNHK